MPYQVEIRNQEKNPYILVTYTQPFNAADDVRNALVEQVTLLKRWQSFPAHVIVDFTHVNIKFMDIVLGMGQVRATTLGEQLDQFEMITAFVGDQELVRIAAESAKQEQYGGFQMKVFTTVKEAQAYVESASGITA